MELDCVRIHGCNVFTSYGDDYVCIDSVRYAENLIVLPDRLIHQWTTASFETLSITDFDFLASLDVEFILFGTGQRQRFLRAELLRPLIEKQKACEVMTNHAVCRTYNILAGEGRKVAASLLFT